MSTLSLPRAVRLRARASVPAVVLFLTAIVLALNGSLPQPDAFSNAELAQFTSLALMLIGIGLGLFMVPLGAALTLAGFAVFWRVEVTAAGSLWLGPAYVLLPVVSALQLAAHWNARRARQGRRLHT